MNRRNRRTANEIRKIQAHLLQAVQREQTATLTDLILKYGADVDVRNTASDKNLVKKQLDQLAARGQIRFQRQGRQLVAEAAEGATSAPPTADNATAVRETPSELTVIKAYAAQLEEFSKILQEQISTLVRMVEKARP